MGRVKATCSFNREITQTSVKGTYSKVGTTNNEKTYEFEHPIELKMFEWQKFASPPAWSEAKKDDDEVSLGSEILLEITPTKSEYFSRYTIGLEKCWASSSETSINTSLPIFVFFDNKCPLAGIPWIKRIMETTDTSKVNTRSISVIQFAFTTAQPDDSFYYHCKISICPNDDDSCISNLTSVACDERGRRSSIITTKPLSRRDTDEKQSDISEGVQAIKVKYEECIENDGIVTSLNGLDHCKGKEIKSSSASGRTILCLIIWLAMY